MSRIDYDGRVFRPVETASNGQVGNGTVFHYHQRGDVVWATYSGGGVEQGTLVATVDASGDLDMRYGHVDTSGALQTGTCQSTPKVGADGRIRLHERWQWTSGDHSSGTSVLEEVG